MAELSQSVYLYNFTLRVASWDGNVYAYLDISLVFVWDDVVQGVVVMATSFIFSFQITG